MTTAITPSVQDIARILIIASSDPSSLIRKHFVCAVAMDYNLDTFNIVSPDA